MAVREKEVKIIRPKKAGEQADIIRVGAYCRVSTDSEDQQNSFFAQVKYYNDYIRQNEKMRLVDIYADEGITGTEMRKREEFKRMLKDARSRKLDRILVKSVTRFARNALECIESVRELTSCGVSVFFENDNLDTKQMNSEMLLYEEQLQKAICRALKTAIQNRKEVMDLILSNLSYALTGENNVLDSYAIERQMETIKGEIDDSIELLEKTEGDKGRIEQMIEQQTNALAALREQLKLVRTKMESNEKVHTEIERIKNLLTDETLCFDIYDDRTVRLLVEYIRVQGDGSIVIMLKGGITIVERVE